MATAAVVIQTDGELVDLTLPGDSSQRLAVLYESLCCRAVDVVALTSQLDMWVDDDGVFTRPVNPVATLLARRFGRVHQVYHGPVLICSVSRDGESVDLQADQLRAVVGMLEELAD